MWTEPRTLLRRIFKLFPIIKSTLIVGYILFPLRAPTAAVLPNTNGRQLFIDISDHIEIDRATGIQRVTRAIMNELLKTPPEGYVVRPVYASFRSAGYYYVEVMQHGDTYSLKTTNTPINAASGDIFLGLNFVRHIILAQSGNLDKLHSLGVKIYFVVHDIIPITHPEFFPAGTSLLHKAWMDKIICYDGLLCVSHTVENEIRNWLSVNHPNLAKTSYISWFHNGCTIPDSMPSSGFPSNAQSMLGQIEKSVSFLMVSTIEPRKNHTQALDAFELLWAEGLEVSLIWVGQAGWKVEKLLRRISCHQEHGNKFLWFSDVSDEYLEKIYDACSAVLMPSECEGFGLSIIEGAKHKKPLLLRNLPVFKEIAKEHATYFNSSSPQDLADTIKIWLTNYHTGTIARSEGISPLTWADSAAMLLSRLPL